MHKKYFTFFLLMIMAVTVFGQVSYSGPADGSISESTVLYTTNFTTSSSLNTRDKFFTHIKASPLTNPTDMLEATGPEGSNFIYDPYAYGIDNSDGDITLFEDFAGIPKTSSIPPDPHMAVGPNHIMQVVNSSFRITDKQGGNVTTIASDTWYGQVLSGAYTFDPKVFYDHFEDRWVMVWLHLDEYNNEAMFLISVSDDSDPNGKWQNFKMSSTLNGNSYAGNWADYQGVGYDDKAIYITSNQFSFNFYYDYTKLRIINKAQLYADSPATVTWKDIWDINYPGSSSSDSFGIRPSRMQDASDTYYLAAISPYTTKTSFGVYKLTNPLTSPSLDGVQVAVTQYSEPDNADQLGGGYPKVESGGTNLRSEPVYQDGILHITHSVANGSRSAVRYLGINTSTDVADIDFAMGDDSHYHIYPALAVNGFGDVLLTYSRSSTSEYIGAYYTVLRAGETEPVGSMTLKEGNGNYVVTYGSGRNRWGDYMGAAFDPADPQKIWMLTEYVSSSDNWATWVGGVNIENNASPLWKADLTVTDAGTGSGTLQFGQAVGATSGIDSEQGENELPPLPPAGVFDARFLMDGNVSSLVDIRSAADEQAEWTVRFQASSSGYPITLSWDSSQLTAGKYTLTDMFGGNIINVNMLQQNEVVVSNTSITSLKIVYGNGQTASTEVTNGWNIVSLPLSVDDASVTSLFPNATSNAFAFGNGYSTVTDLGNGKGYWLKFGAAEQVNFTGQTVNTAIEVSEGWNMVGPFDTEVSTSQIQSDPANIISSVYYSYNNGYKIATELQPGKGYWVKCSAAGTLSFGSVAKSENSEQTLATKSTGKLVFTDANGMQSELYLVEGLNTDKFVLPPKAPVGVLDVRFTNGKMAADLASGSHSIEISEENLPVNLQVVNAELGISQNGTTRTYKAGDVVKITSSNITLFSTVIPESYDLSQNYPNPFNPATTIAFTIPQTEFVTLSVYNMLGEKVTDLVSKKLEAGTHRINFRLDNLSSGTYLYKITAGEFSQAKKMVLLK